MAADRGSIDGLEAAVRTATRPPMNTPKDGTPAVVTVIDEKQLVEAWDALAKVLTEFVNVARQRELTDAKSLEDNVRTRRYVFLCGLLVSLIVMASTVVGIGYAIRVNDKLNEVMEAVAAQSVVTVEAALLAPDTERRTRKVEVLRANIIAHRTDGADAATTASALEILNQLDSPRD